MKLMGLPVTKLSTLYSFPETLRLTCRPLTGFWVKHVGQHSATILSCARFLILSSGLQFLPQLISVFSHGYCFHDKHVLIFFSSNAVFYCCGCCNKYHSVVVKRVDIHFLKILKAGISESRCPQRYFFQDASTL